MSGASSVCHGMFKKCKKKLLKMQLDRKSLIIFLGRVSLVRRT